MEQLRKDVLTTLESFFDGVTTQREYQYLDAVISFAKGEILSDADRKSILAILSVHARDLNSLIERIKNML